MDDKALMRFRSGRDQWQKAFDEAASKGVSRQPHFSTLSNVEIEGLYTPEHVKDLDYAEELGFPGQYPFIRGIHPSMYRGRLWTMRMFSGLGGPEETNQRFKYLLEHGETGLSVAFHFPTLMGYDSDAPISRGEVGKCGVAIDTLKDMEILFDGIPLREVTTSMTINPPASILLAMYIAVAEKQGVDRKTISGTIQNDMLKEFIAQKTLMLPPGPSLRLIVDTVEFCTREVPLWNTISISGYHIREAGSTAVQELAFTLADGIAYVQACIERGLDVDDFAPRLSFFFDSISISLKKSPNSGLPGGSGPKSCVSVLVPRNPGPGCSASTHRQRVSPSRRNSPTTMWSEQPVRLWLRFWAGPSRSIPTHWTRPTPSPRKRQRVLP